MSQSSSHTMAPILWATLAFFVFPLAFMHRPILTFLPEGAMQQGVVWYLALVLCVGVYASRATLPTRLIGWPLAGFSLLALVLQGVAMHTSATFWSSPWSELFDAYGTFCMEGIALLLVFMTLRLLVALPGGLLGLWRGWLATCLLILGTGLLQALWIGTHPEYATTLSQTLVSPPLFGTVHRIADSILSLFSGLGYPDIRTANAGLAVINGGFASGRMLCLAIALIVGPYLFGLFAVSGVWIRRFLGLMIITLFPVLYATGSEAALLVAALLGLWILIAFVRRVPLSAKHWTILALLSFVAINALALLVYLHAQTRGILLRALESGWNPTRLGIMQELAKTFMEHPIFGVGRGWVEAFVMYSNTLIVTIGPESTQKWLDGASMPQPSFLLRVLTEFGALLIALAGVSLLWLGLRLLRQTRENPYSDLPQTAKTFVLWLSALLIVLVGSPEEAPLLFALPLAVFWGVSLHDGEPAKPPRKKSALASDPRKPRPTPPRKQEQKQASYEESEIQAQPDGWAPWEEDERPRKTEKLISNSSSRPFTLR